MITSSPKHCPGPGGRVSEAGDVLLAASYGGAAT
jgi:hypothetical protein